MTIRVEIVRLGSGEYRDLKTVADGLSTVQTQFVFRVAPQARRDALARYRHDFYDAAETLAWTEGYRSSLAGHDADAVVGIMEGRLGNRTEHGKEGNFFGVRKDCCAVITAKDFADYTPSLRAFLSFYLTRYALAFQLGKTRHAKDGDARCVFGPRVDRTQLAPAIADPVVCGPCRRGLGNEWTHEIDQAFLQMSQRVRVEQARSKVSTVIMKGGGVKGIALAGALSVLMGPRTRGHVELRTFVGTSAGAIAAAMLAAGLGAGELKSELNRNFKDFLDPRWKRPFRLLFQGGLHTGDALESWIEDVARRALGDSFQGGATDFVKLSDIKLAHRRVVVFAANRGGTLVFDSDVDTRTRLSRAVRFSMSIPFFFTVKEHEGEDVFDGGLLNNYPVEAFRRENPDFDGEFVAIHLSDQGRPEIRKGLRIARLLSIMVARDDLADIRRHRSATIDINCSPVGTVDFGASDLAKGLLFVRGRLQALRYVQRQGWARADLATHEGDVHPRLRPIEAAIVADVKLSGRAERILKHRAARTRKRRVLLFVTTLLLLVCGLVVYLALKP